MNAPAAAALLPTPAPPTDVVLYIVDDDPAVRSALQLLTHCCGWRARSFDSGAAFLDAQLDDCAACVLLDLNMPHMDGEEVLRQLAARGSQLPVVVITGDRQGARLDRVRRLGARDVLEKPFGEHAFMRAVLGAIGQPQAAESGHKLG